MGNETVLLVEHDEAIRNMARLVLQLKGYSVLEAANGPDAALLSDRHAGPIHLLITDLATPPMGGRALAEKLALAGRRPRRCSCRGTPKQAAQYQGLVSATVDFLQKPFDLTRWRGKSAKFWTGAPNWLWHYPVYHVGKLGKVLCLIPGSWRYRVPNSGEFEFGYENEARFNVRLLAIRVE